MYTRDIIAMWKALLQIWIVLRAKKLLKEYTINQVVFLNMNWKQEYQWICKYRKTVPFIIVAVSSGENTALTSLQIVYYKKYAHTV